MAYTPVGGAIVIASSLLSYAHIGPGAIKLASGIASGLDTWLHAVPITTVDVGVVGLGVGIIPLIVPLPALLAAVTIGFTSQGILGPMAVLTIPAIATGLTQAFIQAQVITQHPGVGLGACVVRFGSLSAVQPMIQGFATQKMTTQGSIKLATAIGMAIDIVFAVLTLPSPIAGPAGPLPFAGVGFGNVF